MKSNLLAIVRRVLGMPPDPPNAPQRMQERAELDQRQREIAARLHAAGIDAEVVTRTLQMQDRGHEHE